MRLLIQLLTDPLVGYIGLGVIGGLLGWYLGVAGMFIALPVGIVGGYIIVTRFK